MKYAILISLLFVAFASARFSVPGESWSTQWTANLDGRRFQRADFASVLCYDTSRAAQGIYGVQGHIGYGLVVQGTLSGGNSTATGSWVMAADRRSSKWSDRMLEGQFVLRMAESGDSWEGEFWDGWAEKPEDPQLVTMVTATRSTQNPDDDKVVVNPTAAECLMFDYDTRNNFDDGYYTDSQNGEMASCLDGQDANIKARRVLRVKHGKEKRTGFQVNGVSPFQSGNTYFGNVVRGDYYANGAYVGGAVCKTLDATTSACLLVKGNFVSMFYGGSCGNCDKAYQGIVQVQRSQQADDSKFDCGSANGLVVSFAIMMVTLFIGVMF